MAVKKPFSFFGLLSNSGTRISKKSNSTGVLKIALFICCFALVLAGFTFLDGYVKKETTGQSGSRSIELVGDVPDWVSEEIKNRIYAAATAEANSDNSTAEDKIAVTAQQNIAQMVPWLADARVQTTHKSVLITGRWRKPMLLVTADKNKFYIDSELVVLDYITINLPVISIAGLELSKIPPTPGHVFKGDDLSAGMAVLNRLSRMDSAVSADKPLLHHIDRIDVSNFDGRKNKREPHISLYTKDGTQIIWGSELGTWQRHLESPDDDKLAKLYTYYQQYGTLSGVKYINLRDPQQKIYLPVDKY